MTDTTSSNLQLVQDACAAFGRGDIDSVMAAMHPDIDWHEAEHSPWYAPDGHRGRAEVLTNVFARIPRDYDSFEVQPTAFHDAGETVIVEGRYRAIALPGHQRIDLMIEPSRSSSRTSAVDSLRRLSRTA